MSKNASYWAGLWIGAAISNTSHSNKAGSTTFKQHGSQVKDLGRRKCCHNKNKKFLIGIHVMHLYFPDTPRTTYVGVLNCHWIVI